MTATKLRVYAAGPAPDRAPVGPAAPTAERGSRRAAGRHAAKACPPRTCPSDCAAAAPLDVVSVDGAARLQAAVRPVDSDSDRIAVAVVVEVVTSHGRVLFHLDPDEFDAAAAELLAELNQPGLLYQVADIAEPSTTDDAPAGSTA